jgi:hypothetical protein
MSFGEKNIETREVMKKDENVKKGKKTKEKAEIDIKRAK